MQCCFTGPIKSVCFEPLKRVSSWQLPNCQVPWRVQKLWGNSLEYSLLGHTSLLFLPFRASPHVLAKECGCSYFQHQHLFCAWLKVSVQNKHEELPAQVQSSLSQSHSSGSIFCSLKLYGKTEGDFRPPHLFQLRKEMQQDAKYEHLVSSADLTCRSQEYEERHQLSPQTHINTEIAGNEMTETTS